MNNFLIISYEFNPYSRMGKLAAALSNENYRVTVLTLCSATDTTPDADEKVCGLYNIIRIPAEHMSVYASTFGRYFYDKYCSPDTTVTLYRKCKKSIFEAVDSIAPDVVITDAFPYTNHITGLDIKRRYPDIKWIADFGDEWTSSPLFRCSRLRLRREMRLESNIFAYADRITVPTEELAEHFTSVYPSEAEIISCVPYCTSELDFPGCPSSSKDRFTIYYSINRRKPSNNSPFLTPLALLLVMKKLPRDKITVIYSGKCNKKRLTDEIKSYLLDENINIVSDISYEDNKKYLLSADALLVLEDDYQGAEASTSECLYDYLNLGKPIIGIVPDGGISQSVIESTGTGMCAAPDKLEDIQSILLRLYTERISGKHSFKPNADEIDRYSLSRMAESFIRIAECC